MNDNFDLNNTPATDKISHGNSTDDFEKYFKENFPEKKNDENIFLNHNISNPMESQKLQQSIPVENNKQQNVNPNQPVFNPLKNNGYEQQRNSVQPQMQKIFFQNNGIPVSPLIDEKQYIKNTYRNVALILIILEVATLICSLIGYSVFSSLKLLEIIDIMPDSSRTGMTEQIINNILYIVCMALPMLIFTFVGNKISHDKIKPLFKAKTISIGFMLSAIIIGIGIQQFAGIIANIINDFTLELGFEIYDSDIDICYEPRYVIFNTICTGFVAPIIEEMFFRGYVFKNLSKFDTRFGMIMSAFIFGLAHGNIPQFVLAFPVGILLAYVAYKTDSILPCIIIHICINLSNCIISYITDYDLQDKIYLIMLATFIITGIFILIFAFKKHKINFPKSDIPKRERGHKLFKSCGSVIVLYIIYGLLFVINLLTFNIHSPQ